MQCSTTACDSSRARPRHRYTCYACRAAACRIGPRAVSSQLRNAAAALYRFKQLVLAGRTIILVC